MEEKTHSHREVIMLLQLAQQAVALVPVDHPCNFSKAIAGMIGLVPVLAGMQNGGHLLHELYETIWKGFVQKHLPELQAAGLQLTPEGEQKQWDDSAPPSDPTNWN